MKWRKLSDVQVLALVFVALFLLMWALNPRGFLSTGNLQSMAFQLPELGLLSLAMMITMVSGGIDLSVLTTSNLAGIVTALALGQLVGADTGIGAALFGTALAICAGLSVSLFIGFANGLLIGAVGASPILATLGTMTLVGGIALVLTGGSAVSGLPATIAPIGNETLLGVPVPLWIFAVCAIAVAVLLERTPWAFRLYLLGANPTATLFSGVNNRRVTVFAYALSGLLCGIAGMIMISRFNSAKAGYGESYLLITILAAVLGGTSPTGGFGRVPGLVLSLAILQVISSGLNQLRVSPFLTIAMWGAIILLVMALNRILQILERRSLTRGSKNGARI